MSRRYTESEVRAILANAIDDDATGSSMITDGLSLEQVKEIGVEVGIDGGRIERAARSVPSPSHRRQGLLIGAPTTYSVERRVESRTQPTPPNEILSVIRRGMGRPGELSDTDGLLEWRASGELGQRVITVYSSPNNTTVSGMLDLGQAAIVTHLPANLLGVIGSAIGFVAAANVGSEPGMLLAATVLPAVFFTTRRLFARLFRTETSKLEGVIEDLTDLMAKSVEDEQG